MIHEYYPVYYPRWYSYPYYGNTITLDGKIGTIYTTNSADTLTIGTNTGSISTYGGVLNDSNYGSSLTNCPLTSVSLTSGNNAYYNSVGGSIETGRVEKGEKSNQQFVDVDMEFEKNYIHHLVYQILPSSRKPKDIQEVSKTKKIMEKLRNDNTDNAIELIKKLADLHSSGILTDEEFSSKKSELLSKI